MAGKLVVDIQRLSGCIPEELIADAEFDEDDMPPVQNSINKTPLNASYNCLSVNSLSSGGCDVSSTGSDIITAPSDEEFLGDFEEESTSFMNSSIPIVVNDSVLVDESAKEEQHPKITCRYCPSLNCLHLQI